MDRGAEVRVVTRRRVEVMDRATACIALGCLLFVMTACDSRARAIESKLGPQQARLFSRGKQLSTECWSCHDFYAENNKIGPHLVGVMGRRAGSLPAFAYSPGMRTSGIVWDRATLRAFLANPAARVPGTTMVSRGVGGAANLDALAFYVQQVSAYSSTEAR